MKKPILFIFLIFTILLSVSSMSLFSQTQSFWSKVRKEKFEDVGLSALQYQTPLWGDTRTFFDPDNLHQAFQSWITKDFNNDGFTDIFLSFFTDDSQNISAPFMLFFYNPKTGTYVNKSDRIKNNIGQPFNRKAMAADFNGDGILDIVAVSHPECVQCTYSYFDIILSTSDTTWTQNRLKKLDRFKNEGYYHGVAVGDIDNDGDIDIVLGEENQNGMYSLINDGKANFKQIQAVTIDRGPDFVTKAYTLELADINKDGCLDLLYWHDKSNTRILFGDCSQTFGKVFQDLTPYTQKFPLVMDYDVRDLDGDGDYDLILTATDYTTGWQLIFLENNGNDSSGKINWIDHTSEITNDLISNGFYKDEYSSNWVPYIHVMDINEDGKLDIFPQKAFTNVERMSQWILISEGPWKYKYKSLPFVDPVKNLNHTLTGNGKINLSWKREKIFDFTSDGGIKKWAIYVSDKTWGDRIQVSETIIVSASETQSEDGFDHVLIDATSKEMYIRISPIDSYGIEWPLSIIHKITIDPPTISSAVICDAQTLTITGSNFVGVKSIKVGNSDVISFDILSESTLQAKLNTGQVGNVYLVTAGGSAEYFKTTNVSAPEQPFFMTGKSKILKGSTETFSVANIEGISYNWSFPHGWEIISGNNTYSVIVKVGAASGDINVFPSAICGSIKPITFPVKVYTYIPDDNFQKALFDLGIDKENKPDSVLSSSVIDVTTLDISSKNISDLMGIEDFTSLVSLSCFNNQLSTLNITQNMVLTHLNCNGNQLSSLDVTKNSLLQGLFVSGNQIKNIDLSRNTNLTVFHSNANPLKNLDVSPNTNLVELSCSDNQLTDLNLSKNAKLTTLYCGHNELNSLNLKNGNNGSITYMDAQNNPNLTCIIVDAPVQAATYPNWKKDATANYSDYCISTGTELPELNQSIAVTPNPSSGIFKIVGLPTNRANQITIYSIDGRIIRKLISNSTTETIDITDKGAGVYVLFINGQPFKLLKD